MTRDPMRTEQWLIIGYNLILLLQVFVLGIPAGNVLLIFWFENVLLGIVALVSLLRARTLHDGEHLLNISSLYDAARLVGETVREVVDRDTGQQASNIDFGCSFLVGGQIRGEQPRLFNVYPQGNFIESSTDTPFSRLANPNTASRFWTG